MKRAAQFHSQPVSSPPPPVTDRSTPFTMQSTNMACEDRISPVNLPHDDSPEEPIEATSSSCVTDDGGVSSVDETTEAIDDREAACVLMLFTRDFKKSRKRLVSEI
jgi:hypothetical protein